MKTFDVYPLINVTPVKAIGASIWDSEGTEYIDLYGGHAVISIGHSHPHFNQRIKEQLDQIAFYSNSIHIPIQKQLAAKLGEVSGLENYELFLCNSGAEANENALKLASFSTGKPGFISFSGAFHGRTAGAVVLTDNPKIIAPSNRRSDVYILPWGDLEAVEQQLATGTIAGIIIEGIQGVGGIHVPEASTLQQLAHLAKKYEAKLILDEVQSGYGRTGRFFAFQWAAGLEPDLITVAKGMGNGFPIGGVLIHPSIQSSFGMLGTTFGGNHLACAAGLAVLEVIENEQLISFAETMGTKLIPILQGIHGITDVRGKGLMIGIDLDRDAAPVRNELVHTYKMFTGSAASKQTIRLLPPLNIDEDLLVKFAKNLSIILN